MLKDSVDLEMTNKRELFLLFWSLHNLFNQLTTIQQLLENLQEKKANFGPLKMRQPIAPNVNHSLCYNLIWRSLRASLGHYRGWVPKPSQVDSGFGLETFWLWIQWLNSLHYSPKAVYWISKYYALELKKAVLWWFS